MIHWPFMPSWTHTSFLQLGFPQLKLLKHELHVFITSYIKMGKGSTGLIKTNKVWYDLSLYYK